jgi:HEAT repeat protein
MADISSQFLDSNGPMSRDPIDHSLAELTCGDDARAEQAVKQISRLPGEKLQPALQSLHTLLSSPTPDQRWWAARALAEIPDPRVPAWLAERLQDEDPAVRLCAALGLRLHPTAGAIPALIRLLNEDDPLLARLASDALSATGEQAVTALIEFLHEDGNTSPPLGPHAHREAVRALSAASDPRAIPVLYERLEDESSLQAYYAGRGLERLGVGMVFFKP